MLEYHQIDRNTYNDAAMAYKYLELNKSFKFWNKISIFNYRNRPEVCNWN